jgi:hypothetical protein
MPYAQKVKAEQPDFDRQRIEAQRKRRACYTLSEGMLDHVKEAQLRYKIPFDDPTGDMSTVVDRVKNGEYTLLDVHEDGEKIGWVVYSVEEDLKGSEFIIVAAFGKTKSGEPCAIQMLGILEGLAKQKGCRSIRLHTIKLGFIDKLIHRDNPWFLSEFVLRKEIECSQS